MNRSIILYCSIVHCNSNIQKYNRNNTHIVKKFFKLIKDNINLSLYDLSNKIVRSVRDFEERNLFDDITLLIFKRNV